MHTNVIKFGVFFVCVKAYVIARDPVFGDIERFGELWIGPFNTEPEVNRWHAAFLVGIKCQQTARCEMARIHCVSRRIARRVTASLEPGDPVECAMALSQNIRHQAELAL